MWHKQLLPLTLLNLNILSLVSPQVQYTHCLEIITSTREVLILLWDNMISLDLWSYSPFRELQQIINENRNCLHFHDIYHKLVDFVRNSLPAVGLKPITLGCLGMLICHKLVTVILQIVVAQATKPVILGSPMHSDRTVSCANTNADAGKRQENNAVAFQAGAPKKMTMSNDNAEEEFTRKRRKSKKIVNEK